jgi:pimeloyl-ACP methyl ester carboxylesterase
MQTKCLLILIALLHVLRVEAQNDKKNAYLLAGMGGDQRIYTYLELDSNFNVIPIIYSQPDPDDDMRSYAHKLINQIDTTEDFILIGVSLGGMLAVEINDSIHPEQVILISSAKNRNELPVRYKMWNAVPIHRHISPELYLKSADFLQPIIERDRNSQEEIFEAMLKDKDPVFIQRTVAMVIEWERDSCTALNITHIHGDIDHTLPLKHISPSFIVENGSHMIMLTNSNEVNAAIKLALAIEGNPRS